MEENLESAFVGKFGWNVFETEFLEITQATLQSQRRLSAWQGTIIQQIITEESTIVQQIINTRLKRAGYWWSDRKMWSQQTECSQRTHPIREEMGS